MTDENQLPEQWTAADRAAVLALAEIIVAYQPASAAEAVQILEAAIKHSPDAAADWKAAAQVPLILATAELPGRRDDALAGLAQLAKDNPENGAIQEKYADLLLAAGDAASLKLALDRWRIIASRTKPRTPRWYKAKYSVALAQIQRGDRASAATLLKYVLETPPGISDAAWDANYRQLLDEIERKTRSAKTP